MESGFSPRASSCRVVQLRTGDLLKVEVRPPSKVQLYIGSDPLVQFGVGGDGKFRLGATLTAIGQKVEIVDMSLNPPDQAGSNSKRWCSYNDTS